MPEYSNLEYFLLEYAPSPLRATRIPVGLLLFDNARRLVRSGFAQDMRGVMRVVRCLDPNADVETLAALPHHFGNLMADASPMAQSAPRESFSLYERLQALRQETCGGVQVSAPRGVLSLDVDAEFERLMRQYVNPPREARVRRPVREGSRHWIHAQLTDALKKQSLYDRLTRDVSVAEFTAPGDGFRLDFSYKPNGTTKYLHALSLERDWNHAKLLSYTYWRIQQKTSAEITAIVGDTDDKSASAQSCRQLLSDANVRIQPLSQLGPYLDSIGREMRIV